ncbi:MgtC/SapB family protein [Bacillus paranthracis]|uniref:MgtC/SapB family protein n=1 Tax=Bacillus paranthracis TaxID=2026186 RepID=UPI002E1D434C|nr:MgtC/SapB family protein [Bacillus paranthracis]MED1682459.1 MgtC/SapB family protein [Bacillus paranthracis]
MVWYDIVLRLFIAIIVGACIGMERQWRHRMAGLRTNALVSLGACIFVLLSVMIDHDASPSRIASQVVSGIGFLGGGVIIRDGFSIRGLNTAATLWCAAGVLLANILLRPIALFMNQKSKEESPEQTNYLLSLTCSEEHEAHIHFLLMHMVSSEGIGLKELYSEDVDSNQKVCIQATLHCNTNTAVLIEKIVSRMLLESGVTAAGWKTSLDLEAS